MNVQSKEKYQLKKLDGTQLEAIIRLTKQLNPNKSHDLIFQRIEQLFKHDNYDFIGFFNDGQLVGLTGCWTMVRIYSGKQLEVDNVIIDKRFQSKGYGKLFFEILEEWAFENGYNTLELNTYVTNDRSHKFYFNQGYTIGGYRFHKVLTDITL